MNLSVNESLSIRLINHLLKNWWLFNDYLLPINQRLKTSQCPPVSGFISIPTSALSKKKGESGVWMGNGVGLFSYLIKNHDQITIGVRGV